MSDYGIYVKKDLLEPKHYQAIGEALWLYLWFLDHVTSIEGGIGQVLGGKPIKHSDVVEQIPLSQRSYSHQLDRLRDGGYISTVRTPYGLTVTVHKSAKIFGNKIGKRDMQYKSISRRRDVQQKSRDVQQKSIYIDNTMTIQKEINKESYKRSDNRGNYSQAADRIREVIKRGGVKALTTLTEGKKVITHETTNHPGSPKPLPDTAEDAGI